MHAINIATPQDDTLNVFSANGVTPTAARDTLNRIAMTTHHDTGERFQKLLPAALQNNPSSIEMHNTTDTDTAAQLSNSTVDKILSIIFTDDKGCGELRVYDCQADSYVFHAPLDGDLTEAYALFK